MSDKRKISVLVVDDDPSLRSFLESLLYENGFTPIVIEGSSKLESIIWTQCIDIALMDLRLKGESGLTLAQKLQHSYKIPVIMLTGVADETEKIVGLELAADDYVMKPFNPRELIARIRAVLRRTYGLGLQKSAQTLAPEFDNCQRFGDYFANLQRRVLFKKDGSEVQLTNMEFKLLEVFLNHPNRVLNRSELLSLLGPNCDDYIDRTIDVLILKLRRKIEQVPSKPMFLQTRRGEGYVFVMD